MKTVLVVDDEQNVRLLISKMLSQYYIVIEASDGEEAINFARTKKPDVILMDIMMPKMDGYTACSVLKHDPATKAIPVVMVTALGQRLNEKLAQNLGADGYVSKPFTAMELLGTIGGFFKTQEKV